MCETGRRLVGLVQRTLPMFVLQPFFLYALCHSLYGHRAVAHCEMLVTVKVCQTRRHLDSNSKLQFYYYLVLFSLNTFRKGKKSRGAQHRKCTDRCLHSSASLYHHKGNKSILAVPTVKIGQQPFGRASTHTTFSP